MEIETLKTEASRGNSLSHFISSHSIDWPPTDQRYFPHSSEDTKMREGGEKLDKRTERGVQAQPARMSPLYFSFSPILLSSFQQASSFSWDAANCCTSHARSTFQVQRSTHLEQYSLSMSTSMSMTRPGFPQYKYTQNSSIENTNFLPFLPFLCLFFAPLSPSPSPCLPDNAQLSLLLLQS